MAYVSCAGSAGSSLARRDQWQKTGFAFGWASLWPVGPWLSGRAMTWVFSIVPFGPSEVCSQSVSRFSASAPSSVADVAADLDDVVQVEPVVGGIDLDEHAQHPPAVAHLRCIEDRQEHPCSGMGIEVGRSGLAGLMELLQVHRHVARREGIAPARLANDGQIDAQGGHDYSRGNRRRRGRGARSRARAVERRERQQPARGRAVRRFDDDRVRGRDAGLGRGGVGQEAGGDQRDSAGRQQRGDDAVLDSIEKGAHGAPS